MSHPRPNDDGHARAHPGDGHPPAVQTPADVRRLLAEQISQLTAHPDLDPLRKARQLAPLARAVLRAMEIEKLDARVEAIETVLCRRKQHPGRSDGAMNTQAPQSPYHQFTSEERVRLVLAAVAREDADEIERLVDTCPRVGVVRHDPAYTDLFDRIRNAGREVRCQWLDVSHRVVRSSLEIRALNRRVLFEVIPGSMKERKIAQDRDWRLGTEAQAEWTKQSAAWKGIEAAITRFCEERDLTTERLFAAKHLPPVIEEARVYLHADVATNLEEEAEFYEFLCDMVPPQQARGRG